MTSDSSGSSTTVTFPIEAGGFHYFVGLQVDCGNVTKLEVTSSMTSLAFTFPSVPNRSYELSVTKLTEASTGKMSLSEPSVSNGGSLLPIPDVSCHARPYRFLTIGDSISAGYGVSGVYPCTWSVDTENALSAWPAIVGERAEASAMVVAWSGKGMVRNYGDKMTTSEDPMPTYYNRTLGEDATLLWDTSKYVPDIVIVALGSNDYSTSPNPSDEEFTAGYISFLSRLSSDFPSALILCICEPLPGVHECSNVSSAAALFNATFVTIPDDIYVAPNGCDYHPSIEGQKRIADVVAPVVKELLSGVSRL
jgi:lysophospholipase L1-like esterase